MKYDIETLREYVKNIPNYIKSGAACIDDRIKTLSKPQRHNLISFAVLVSVVFVILNFANSSTLRSWSQTYGRLSTPLSSYILGAKLVDFAVMPAKGGKVAVTFIPLIQSIKLNMDEKNDVDYYHTNFLIKLLCMGNNSALAYLNMAYVQGQYVTPYVLFVYGKQANYESKFLPAPAVLLYNFSWLLNVPGKFLSNIDQQLQHLRNTYSGESIMWMFLVDDVISFVFTALIDIPMCLINTVFGFFTGLVHHPIQSVLTIPGCLYFGMVTTVNALWEIISNIVLILIHMF